MDWIEIIHLRSHSHRDKEEALTAFHNLSQPIRIHRLLNVTLYQSQTVGNDLSIFIHWRGSPSREGKSPLGLQLAAAFSEFGHISHFVWVHESSLFNEQRRQNDDIQSLA